MKKFNWRFSKLEKKYLDTILYGGLGGRKKSYKYLLEDAFTKKFNVDYSISFNSCTSALHSSFVALNLKKNSEVLVPALTPIMCSSTIHLAGLVPVYIDVDPETFLIDYDDLSSHKQKFKEILSFYKLLECGKIEAKHFQ